MIKILLADLVIEIDNKYDYLREFYDVLHTTGYQYINNDIDIYLNARNAVMPN